MERYKNIDIKKSENNKRVYKTTIYPKIEVEEDDVYIFPNRSDRLDLLANQYYGDPSLWWVIAHANHIGKGTMKIKTGIQIRIPQNLSKILADFKRLNEVR
jgi:nucleoid-associated protein YgaU